MKFIVFIGLLFLCVHGRAQQTIMYTQYTFNKAGMNPAASGTEMNQKYYFAFGFTRMMYAIDDAPKQHFFNFSYTIRPPRSYRYWQNIGVYLENDDSGLLGYSSGYLNYTLHTLFRKKTVVSFGIYAGARRFARSTGGFDRNDPAVANSRNAVILYPDIIPGVRIANAKSFMDISVRQITVNRLREFNGRRIGRNSLLLPTVFFDYGIKKPLSDRLLMMPSFAVNAPVIGLPSLEFTLMFYYANRVGGGLAIRNIGFASAIFQIRFLENITAGFAYSYPLSQMRHVAPHGFEFVVGIVPFGMDSKVTGRHSVARCPTLSY